MASTVPVSYRNYEGAEKRPNWFLSRVTGNLMIYFTFNFSSLSVKLLENCFLSTSHLTELILKSANAPWLINFNGCFYYKVVRVLRE